MSSTRGVVQGFLDRIRTIVPAGSSSRRAQAAPPFKRKPLFESLEQRLLLSADIAPAAATGLVDGMQELRDWAGGLQAYGALSQALPVGQGADPISIGAALDLATLFDQKLFAPVQAYLGGAGQKTTDGLVGALGAVAGITSVSGDQFGDELRFDVVLDVNKALPGLKINIGATQDGTQVTTDANGTVDATGGLLLDFSFGLDLDTQLAPQEAFFIDIDTFEASVDAAETGLDFGANIGFLGANVANGSFNLDAALAVGLNNPDNDAEGKITLAELLGTTLEGLVAFTPTGSFNANFPISVTLGAFTPANTALTVAGNPLDPSTLIVNVAGTNAEDILNFGRANKFIVAEALQQLSGWLDSLNTSDAFAQAFPFAQGTDFSDVLNLGQAFTEGFLDQLEAAPGVPVFDNAQQFAQEIADLMFGGDTSPVALDYNPSTNQLTFHLRLDRTFADVQTPVGFSVNLAPLGGLSSSSTLDISADGRIEFTVGFDLSPFLATWLSATDLPLNGVLSADASFLVRVNDATQPTLVTVARDAANTTRSALVTDINAAIQAAGVTGLSASLQGARLRFNVTGNALGANLQFSVPNDASNPAKSELGLPVVGFAGDGLTGKTFLRDIRVTGHAEFTAADVDATAAFGIFQVGIANGTVSGEATVDVQVRKSGNPAIPIYMGELYQAVNLIPSYTSITKSGSVSGNLPIALQGPAVISLPGSPRVQFSMSNVFQPGTLTVTVQDLAPLQAYQNFDVADVIAGLNSLANFFNSVEGFSFLNQKLPLLNKSVTDLVSFVDNFQSAVTSLTNAGPITLQQLEQKLEQALGLSAGALSMSLTATDLLIQLNIVEQLPAGLQQMAMDLDLASLAGGNANLSGVGHLIDVGGSAKLNVSAAAELDLNFGFDLTTPSNPRAYIRDDSSLALTARVSGSNLDFDAAIGPLGLFIRDGVVRLDNGVGIPAAFMLALNPATDDKWYSNQWGTGIVNAAVIGQVHATLPVYFPLATNLLGTIQLDIGNLASIAATTTVSAPNIAAEIQAINLFDDMDALVQGIDLILAGIQDAMDGEFLGLELPIIGDSLKDQAKFVETLRQELKTALSAAFGSGGTSAIAVQEALFDALGQAGLDVLPDVVNEASDIAFQRFNDAQGKAERIEFDLQLHQDEGIEVPIAFDIGLPGLGLAAAANSAVKLALAYDMRLGFGVSRSQGVYLKTYDSEDELQVGVSASLDNAAFGGTLGFLRVRIEDDAANPTQLFGGVTLNLIDPDDRITFNELAGGANLGNMLDIDFELTAEANLHLEAGAPNFQVTDPASANFFLQEFPRVEAEFNLLWTFTPGGPATGTLERAELNDVRLNLGTFFSGFLGPIFDVLDPILEAAAPLIDVLTEPLPVFSDIAGRDYTLIDLAQDVNSVTNFISPEALDFIEAMVILLDVIEDIDSFGGDGVYIEFGGIDLKTFDLKNPNFSFGGFGANQNPFQGKQINTPGTSLQDQLQDKASGFAQQKSSIKGTGGSGFSIPLIDNPLRVFDLLLGRDVELFRYDMPEFAFEFSHRWKFGPVYAPPPVYVTLSGGIKAGFNFGFGYDTSGLRKMFEQAQDGGPVNPLLVFDGFFVADWDAAGNERAEAYIEGKIGAGAEVSAIIVSVGAEGGIFARVGLDLHDPNNDGRMHGYEILSELAGGGGPICLFDFVGEIGAFLQIFVEIGISPFSFTFEMEIARVTLIDWTIDICHEPPPILATQVGDELFLNMGPRAGERVHGDIVDDDEAFVVKNLAEGTVMVEAFGFTQVYGKYKLDADGELIEAGTAITKIIADGGAMNDSIEIEANVPMITDLKGGAGDDVLIAGGGAAFIQGGAGKDTIYGSANGDQIYGDTQDGSGAQGDDIIHGGQGNDQLFGGGGVDYVYGELGDDEIHGGDGADLLFGQDGRDHIFGDAGEDGIFGGIGADQLEGGGGTDYLVGGDAEAGLRDELYGDYEFGTDDDARDYLWGDEAAGQLPESLADFVAPGTVTFADDLLFGQGGSDYLYGEAGLDEIFGGTGDDFIFGGSGNDLIRGEIGNDDISGGSGEDLVYGGLGNDTIRGDQDNDLVYGEAGADFILGGSGEDTLYGGADNDLIRGQEGDDQVYGDAGNDDLHGDAGQDLLVGGLGNDILTGGAHEDRLHGSDGDDTLFGSAGADYLYGEAGADAIFGNSGDDYLDGGSGADSLFGGEGADTLMAGTGLGKQLFGDAGDDLIVGAADGREDLDLLDATYFGDLIHGGSGNDRIYGLSGADVIHGDAGDDEIWGGAHGDRLLGGEGFDRLYGGIGADRVEGGADGDYLDGGFDADLLFGDAGDDEILGGGGADEISGGAGDDVLRGSDDAPDTIHGDAGRDRIFGNGGNDSLFGDAGDDILDGGLGDDVIEGGLGSDVLLGGAQHDSLYGHSASGSGDDAAVDYLYGDFGTNLNDAGAGRDRLFGQGGNDVLFGEGGDDLIDAGGGASNLVSFGAGEGANPADFVTPAATPNPSLNAPADEPYALPQLPAGLTPGGRWTEFVGSASGEGVSSSQAAAIEPALAIDANGNRYLAWADARNGNYEIYVLRHTGSGWEMLAGSAEGKGISASIGESRRPSIAIDADGNPIVAWAERNYSVLGVTSNIKVARFDPAADGGAGAWVALGESLDGNGISNSGLADDPTVLITAGGPVVTWLDSVSGTRQVYAKRFAAGAWSAFGTNGASAGGVSNAPVDVAEYAAATDGNEVAVTFSRLAGSDHEVYLTRSGGGAWGAPGNAAIGNGLSDNVGESRNPTVAYHGGSIFVAWQDQGSLRQEIFARRLDGNAWVPAGTDAAQGQGVSATTGFAAKPKLAVAGGELFLMWADHSVIDRPDNAVSLFAKRWTGSAFAQPLDGDAANRGISPTARQVQSFALALDADGRPFVAWSAANEGAPQIYLRGDTLANATVHQVANLAALQALLGGGSLGANDIVLLASGDYNGTVTIGADDSGVTIVGDGAQDSVFSGTVHIDGASGVTLARIRFTGEVNATNTSGLTLVDNEFVDAPLSLSGGTDLKIIHNRFAGDGGIVIAAAAAGRITHNDIGASGTGLAIDAAFTGLIDHNDIHGASVGVAYNAAAALAANRIHGNGTGVRATLTGANALGFVAGSASNEIYGNPVGIELQAARVQNQHVFENSTGVSGSGTIGGDSLAAANLIERNGTGVGGFTGTVQFSRIAHNTVGIQATAGLQLLHNLVYRNTEQGLNIAGVADVRVYQNTFHAPSGDNIRLSGGASNVEVRGNILWAESGYDLYVANDSQSGFFSDYNDLYATGSGRIGYWTKDFVDVLDWQADIAKFDLHSIGHTVIDPTWARPQFLHAGSGDYRLFAPVAGLRFTSPTVDAADARMDTLRPAAEVNLLANPGFETGVSSWVTNVGGTVRSANPAAFEGGGYFAAGNIEEGFAEQVIDLIAKGYSAAQLDLSDLEVVFSGRLRSLAESPADRGKVRITFLSATATVLGTVESSALNESTRWELVGARSEIPVGTRSIAFRFIADRDSGTSNDAFFDHAFLGIVSESVAPDIGAYGHAATDVGLAATPRVNLRFPDLYTDWEKDKPLTIRWETFGNTTDAPVRIDLYQDGPDGPALRATIALATPDDGEHIWIPSSNGVDFATYGLRIQVSLTSNPLVLDRSTETFTVPEDGDQYWVDDLSNANDAYTPAATGSNRHTGKLPTAPKPNPVNLVRTYALDAGSTLFIDAGTYPMIYPVSVSGTFDLGLGLDEGFRMTGPNDPASIALLLPAIPGDQSRPLIELNDADFVTIEHLSLANALRGLDVANGSDSFTATWLTAYGHAADGLRINTDAPFAAYHHLTAYDNTGRGIFIDGPIASFSDGLAYNNTTDGIYITGAVALVADSVAYDNGQVGLEVQSPGAGARIEGNSAYGNNLGLQVFNSSSGAAAIVGTTDLSSGRGNLVYGNKAGGISAAYNTRVSGNTVRDQINTTSYGISTFAGASISSNVVSGNYYGISISSGGDVSYNRVYGNSGYGIYGYAGEFVGNVVYSNPVNLYVNSNTTVRNNLVYDSADFGILIPGTSGTKLVNNTVYAATGDAIRIQQNASNVELRNNIVFAGDGYGVSVDSASQSGFKSDYNLFFTAGAGVVGLWQGVDRNGLTAWRNATFGDKASLFGDPLFVDADGADGAIGYVSPANDGRDDDFHIRSQYGSFKGTALAPVRDASTGLPVFVAVPAATLDAATSPALDRGAPTDAFGLEPANNGGYINLGAYGNTAQASRSPAQYMLVTNPNGGEAVPQESTFDIRWRSTGFPGNVAIDLGTVPDAGGSPVWALIADNEANDGTYLWSVDPALYAIGDSYLIRVRSVDVDAIQDRSDTTFAITAPISVFYVNDDSLAVDQYTTAIGNDGNDGLTPATPKATIRSVLETYDLDPGDVIRVDTGQYLLTANIVLEAQDSGVAIEGPTLGGARAVINRGNTASTSFVFQMAGADDVTLRNLAVTGAYHGIYAGNNAGSDRLVVEDSELYGNNQSGAAILDGNNDVAFDANEIYQNGSWGLNFAGSGNRATGNHVWGNGGGIVASYNGQGARIEILDNRVHDNVSDGINGSYWVLVSGNTVYGNAGSYGISMYHFRSLTIDNEIFRSPNGLNLSVGAVGRDNRVYDNPGIGIHLTGGGGGVAEGNVVYANNVGIQESQSRVANNLVYDNASAGIVTSGYRDDAGDGVINNTVVQPDGDAIVVAANAQNVLLRNNVIEVRDGYAINVPATSQIGLSSDYNLFRLSGSGQIGFWEDRGFATLTDWYYEIGLDAESLTADPQFIDPDGADGVRGFGRANVGAAIVIDDGDAGFSTIGAWTETVGALSVTGDPATPYEQAIYNSAYGHDIHEIPAAGNADSVARWSFDGLEDGTYQIAVRWPLGSGVNPQNVQYRAYDGAVGLGNIVGYTVMYQGNAVNDFEVGGVYWERLDTVVIQNGRLIVEMSDRGGNATSRLSADAVRVQRIVGDMGIDDDFRLTVGSPGVDRGDPGSRFEREPVNNGARVDIGAYGNTADATQSPAQLVQVLNPNGLEKYEAGQEVRIDFRSAGLTEFDPVLLMNLGGGALSGLGYWAPGDAPAFGANSSNQSIAAAQALDVSAPNAGPEELYRNYRGLNSGVGTTMGWQFEVPDGEYALRLHFIEPSYTTANQRRFEVSVQGAVVESSLDIFAEAGARYKALVREYAVTAAGGSGIELALKNLTAAGAIISGVEVLRLNAGGVANPTVDLEVSTDAGTSWLPVAGGVALDRYGNGSFLWDAGPVANAALIRATAHAGAAEVDDISDVAFQIANAGTAYYVNDGAATGDEYTTAVGNNANDGKTPSTPMASLAALLRAYDLDAGDVIYVDTGVYNLATNIVLGAEDSGVTIRGPVLATHDAVLDRGNTGAVTIQLAGADDVTIEHVAITGGQHGVYLTSNADSDRITLDSVAVYGNASYGIYISDSASEQFAVRASEIYSNAGAGIVIASRDGRIEDNLVRNNAGGISASGGSGAVIVIAGNTVRNNSSYGVDTNNYALIEDNTVHNNSGWGINSTNASLLRANVVFANTNGIAVGNNAVAEANRVYNHSGDGSNSGIGIYTRDGGSVIGNRVYGNVTGVWDDDYSLVRGNLIYANSLRGIRMTGFQNAGDGVFGNTIYQPAGDAIVVASGGSNTVIRDNILAVGSGYALNVDSNAQGGFASDYNLFWLTGSGKIAFWEDRAFTSLNDWSLEVGFDFESLVANPLFVDSNGADGVLGFAGGVDGGIDDDFRLTVGSPGVDRGDPGSRFEREPVNNGARVDIGAYGNTADATQSPAQLVQVLNPNGLEKYEAGQEVRIDFRSAGLTEFDPVLLMNLGGGALSGLGYWAPGDAPAFGANSSNQSIAAAQALDVSAPNAGPEELYRNYRGLNSGVGTTMGWQFEVPDGEYALRLHFIEPSYTTANQRRFEVSVQGAVVESSLDIFAEAGARYKALVREYAVTAAGGSGIELALKNLTAAGAIISGVEVLRLNAGGVANPTVDLEVSTDAGTSWLPVAGGVALDRYGNGSFLWDAGPVANAALIRATAHAGAAEVDDISDVAFQIANAGTAYYVNDGAATGDEYTTAVGNNANDGKTPSTPMASLAALLRAYDLDAGDLIYVDTGVYNLATNIVLGAEDSGVTIRGPVLATHDAVLDRGNTASNAYVFLFAGADDVTLEYLNVTGAHRAIVTNGATGNDRIALHFMDVYNNAAYGVDINAGNSDWVIADSRIHNNATYGIVSSGERLRVENNEIYGNNQGLVISAGSEAARSFVTGNDVHDNSAIGINISSYVTARGNRAYNQTAGQGIYSYNSTSLVEDNDAYNNATGIQTGYQGSIVGNRSFDNGIGIRGYQGRIYGNQVYSNSTGIVEEGWGEVYNNLVYANTNRGIDVTYNHTSGERGVYNNTVWQDTGDAIRVDATNNVWLRNNLLSIGAGYAINVDGDGQAGFSSDWNLFNLRTGAAFVGRWGASEQAALAAWQALSANHDANGIVGNPRFLDIDGADNVLGDQDVTTGDGYDDNFSLDADSVAIDAGSAYHAALTDIEGRERQDDPTTVNTGIGWDRFVESLPGGSSYAETGTEIPLRTSNGSATVALPFTFEFYGAAYTSVQVSVNGYLHFGGQDNVNTGDDNTQELFLRNVRIAPLWDNLRTDLNQSAASGSTPGNVFVDATVANQITIRWAATRQATGGGDVNFAVTLFANGDVRFDYGDGNQALTPTVGLSAGNGFSFALSQYNGAADLNNAASVYFTRSEGLTYFDIGAYEFLGDSGDTLAPTVTSISQLPAPGGSTAAAFSAIQVETSEALNSISAKSPANYDLRRAGADGDFDTPDDVIISLRPSYSYPETNLTLEFLLGPNATPGILPDGDYRLTLSGTKAIYDLSGNPLDGNADGTGGDDYVRFFTINRTNNVAPVANAQTVNVSEDASVVITLSASDANGDPLAYSLVSDPQHGVLSDFNPAARTVRYTPNAGYTGADSFQFSADDGNAGVGTATVTLNVQPINDAPVAADQSVTLEEDTPRLIVLDGIDTETERADLVFTLGVAPQHGSIVQGAAGGWTYTPDADYFGPDSFTYTVTDRGDPDGSLANVLTSAAATIAITVTPVNDGPKLATVIDQVVAEGSILLVDAAATDPEGGADFEFSLDEAPAGAAIDAATGLFSWTPADGAQSAQVTVRVINAGFPEQFDTETFTINVTNVAPTVAITGAADAVQGQAYQIALSASDPGDDTIAQWEINWGDGQSSVLPGTATSASHVYALGGAAYGVSAQASDEDGTFDSNTIEVAVAHDSLRVTSIEETVTGFKARFSHLIDPTAINLYSGEMPPIAPMGPADVLLFGATKGAVRGSLVFDADGLGFTFVKTGGPLVADSYTLVLKSGSDAFRKTGSFDPLDGDSDGLAGGDFSDDFVVSAPTLPVLGIADFARGNLQPIDVPATAGGLPIRLSDGTGIESIAFTLTLRRDAASPAADPMVVSAIELAPGLPDDAVLSYDLLTNPGVIAISVTLPDGTTFGPGARSLVIVRATVGEDAVYGSKQVLDIGDIAVNGSAGGALDDDGVQVIALLGDTSGDRDYALLDVQRLQRTMVRYDSGFAAYPNADPIIIADINGNGMFSAVDAALLLQEVRFVNDLPATDRPEIPPIPVGVVPVGFVGPDPTVDLPRDLRAKPGDTITVPLRLDTAAGLDSARLRLAWDAQALELLAVERGSLTGDFQWYLERRGEGELYVDMSRMHALAAGSGSLIELRFRVAADAQPGVVDLDLTWASLDEGRLTLSPRPQPGPDAADGVLTIEGDAPAAPVMAPAANAAQGPALSIAQVDAPIPPAAMQSSSISAAPQPAPVAVDAEPTGPVVAPPAPASAARPGILGNLGEVLRRKLLDTIAKAEAEPDVVSIVPATAMPPSWDAVQAPLRIDLASGAADGWSLASFQSANDWLPDFVARDKSLRDDANAELKVTLPRVAPQLAAAGGIAKAAARR